MRRARRRSPFQVLSAIALAVGALAMLVQPVMSFVGPLEVLAARAIAQTITLKEQEKRDRAAVNRERDAALARLAVRQQAFEHAAARGWYPPEQVEADRARFAALEQALEDKARRERQIVSFEARQRIRARLRNTVRDAIKVASGADPRAVEFIAGIFEGRNPLEAAISSALSAETADPRAPFRQLRSELIDVERAARSLSGADAIDFRARIRDVILRTNDLTRGQGPPPDDKIERLLEARRSLDSIRDRFRDLGAEWIPRHQPVDPSRFAEDETWNRVRAELERLNVPNANRRVSSAGMRLAIDRVRAAAERAGRDLSDEEIIELAGAVIDSWVDELNETGGGGNTPLDLDRRVREVFETAEAEAAGLDPRDMPSEDDLVEATEPPSTDPPTTPEPTITPAPEPPATDPPPTDRPETGSFAGQWSTTYGDMTLSGGGDAVSGTYETDDGRVRFTADGRTLDGFWIETGSARECESARDGSLHWGRLVITFDEEFTSFSGAWAYCDDEPNRNWSGDRIRP